jgi:hypothetical protein
MRRSNVGLADASGHAVGGALIKLKVGGGVRCR